MSARDLKRGSESVKHFENVQTRATYEEIGNMKVWKVILEQSTPG